MNNIQTFFNRNKSNTNIDYISIVNETLHKDPTSIDPNSPIYLSAIEQYNGDLKKGNTTRLDVPAGFCGYIDAGGVFRVTPEPDMQSIPPGQAIPLSTLTAPPSAITEGEYPIDKCLINGLAGSPPYSQIAKRVDGDFGKGTIFIATDCGDDDDNVRESGVDWNAIQLENVPEGELPETPIVKSPRKHHHHLSGTDWETDCEYLMRTGYYPPDVGAHGCDHGEQLPPIGSRITTSDGRLVIVTG